jgi:hypothetical protein
MARFPAFYRFLFVEVQDTQSSLPVPSINGRGGLSMGLIRLSTIFVVLGTMFLGIAANAQVNATLPQFKSGASVMMGVPVDFDILNQRVGAIYEVVESNDSHIVWKFTGSTSDWAFVFADGRIVVASTVEFNLAAKDTLAEELNDAMDMINLVGGGITDEARNNALDSAIYYSSEAGIYHRLKHSYGGNFVLTLVVPESRIENARMIELPLSREDSSGTHWFIDNNELEWGSWGHDERGWFFDITDKIPWGMHTISTTSIDVPNTGIIEVITSSRPSKNFVMYGPDYNPWINETGKSMTLDDLNLLITGISINSTI